MKTKIRVILGQQKTTKVLMDPTKLPTTMYAEEKEVMESAAYGVIVLNLIDNMLREVIDKKKKKQHT